MKTRKKNGPKNPIQKSKYFPDLDRNTFLIKNIFYEQNFQSRENIFYLDFSRVKMSSGIKKPYLEHRAMSATMRTIQFLEGDRNTAQKPSILDPFII